MTQHTAGFWHLKAGVQAHYAVEIVESAVNADSLTLRAATKKINHRGDQLNSPVIDINIFSPADNIIGVRLEHFAEDERTYTELFPGGAPPKPTVTASKSESSLKLVSGKISAEVTANPYTLTFSTTGGKTLTFAGSKYQGCIQTSQPSAVLTFVQGSSTFLPNGLLLLRRISLR